MSIIRDGFQSADLDIPVVLPTLNLDFANSQSLDKRITFTRGSIGTYVNKNGLISIASTNEPRFDYNPISGECKGLLIEESRQNLLTYSNSFSTGGAGNWTPVGATCVFTQNQVGPDGVSNSAWTIDDNYALNDGAGFLQSLTITPSTSTNYCLSIFAKKGTSSFFDFYVFFTGNSTKGSYLRYNFNTNTITVFSSDGGGITPTIFGAIQYPNGWYRIYFVANDANNGLNNNIQYRIYPGTRNTGRTGNTIFYGAQLEIGSFPTSYIPTGASTVTRSADLASMTGTNFSSWYNSSEGTVFSSCRGISGTLAKILWSISDGTFGNSNYASFPGNDGNIYFNMINNGSDQIVLGTSSVTSLVTDFLYKSAYAIKQNDRRLSLNGSGVTSIIQSTLPIVNRLFIGSSWSGGVPFLNGTISRLTYYPKALTPAQLQYITS